MQAKYIWGKVGTTYLCTYVCVFANLYVHKVSKQIAESFCEGIEQECYMCKKNAQLKALNKNEIP